MNKIPKAVGAGNNLLYEMPNGEVVYVGSSPLIGVYKRMFKKIDEPEKFLDDDSL